MAVKKTGGTVVIDCPGCCGGDCENCSCPIPDTVYLHIVLLFGDSCLDGVDVELTRSDDPDDPTTCRWEGSADLCGSGPITFGMTVPDGCNCADILLYLICPNDSPDPIVDFSGVLNDSNSFRCDPLCMKFLMTLGVSQACVNSFTAYGYISTEPTGLTDCTGGDQVCPITCGTCKIPRRLLATFSDVTGCGCAVGTHEILYRGSLFGTHYWRGCSVGGDTENVGIDIPQMPQVSPPCAWPFRDVQVTCSNGFGCVSGLVIAQNGKDGEDCATSSGTAYSGASGTVLSTDPFIAEIVITDIGGSGGMCDTFPADGSVKITLTEAP